MHLVCLVQEQGYSITMANSKGKTIYLRHDTKAYEQRTPLTPHGVKKLLDAGYRVIVERCVVLSPTPVQFANPSASAPVSSDQANACRLEHST